MNCKHPVFCQGEILHAISLARLNNDSKLFVDLPLKYNVNQVLENFKKLPDRTQPTLKKFLLDNFE